MLAAWRATGTIGLLLLASASGLAGCDGANDREKSAAAAKASADQAALKAAAPAGGGMTRFEAGTLRAGSVPGSPGRDPEREASLVPIELSAFEIDSAPFPNEAAKPLAEMDYAAATDACSKIGKRLCSELEWEHACKAAGAAAFIRGREWTLSTNGGLAGARGSRESSGTCAARSLIDRSGTLGFRCCRGAEQTSAYPAPTATPNEALGTKALQLSVDEMRKALASVPSLAALAPAFQPFSTSDVDAALRKGKRTRDGITAWSFLPSAIAWTPASSERLVIIAGQSGEQALIAVLYPLGDGTFAHAASAVLREPDATVAIGSSTTSPSPRELLWTSCYGCPNEGGTIRYGDDRRVVIEFR
jgi:hypothetical protein